MSFKPVEVKLENGVLVIVANMNLEILEYNCWRFPETEIAVTETRSGRKYCVSAKRINLETAKELSAGKQ